VAKRCSFCEFASDDTAAFGDHMRDVHQWDRLTSPRPTLPSRRVVLFGLGGGVLAIAAVVWRISNLEQSCLNGVPHGYCGDVWLGLLGVPVYAAIGFGVGVVIANVTRAKAPKTDETKSVG
jgi:hypothetical protein